MNAPVNGAAIAASSSTPAAPGNPRLALLQPYPFERLRGLLKDVVPSPAHAPCDLSIGEPKHATPALVKDALAASLDGLANYPATLGGEALRTTIAAWLQRRYGLARIDAATEVLPVLGSREALFAFAQVAVDPRRDAATASPAAAAADAPAAARDGADARPVVVSPNPFYQIYEGAALLAGAEPVYVEQDPARGFACDWSAVSEATWARTQLLYVCSPGNPTGRVMTQAEWADLFALSDRFGFVIAADECYSEIYADGQQPPLGALQAAAALGRTDWKNLVVFSSLSKRSNVPGLRSGFVAGDAAWIKRFLLYRTYHGSAMSLPVQAASVAAWRDEAHVQDNRRRYAAKFDAVTPIVQQVLQVDRPDAGFYLWARLPDDVLGGDDIAFTRELLARFHVRVLPGSLLSRDTVGADGRRSNPGAGFLRLALVDEHEKCVEAAHRIVALVNELRSGR